MDRLMTSIENFTDAMKKGNYSTSIVMFVVTAGLIQPPEKRPMYLDKMAELARQGKSEDEIRKAAEETIPELQHETTE